MARGCGAQRAVPVLSCSASQGAICDRRVGTASRCNVMLRAAMGQVLKDGYRVSFYNTYLNSACSAILKHKLRVTKVSHSCWLPH